MLAGNVTFLNYKKHVHWHNEAWSKIGIQRATAQWSRRVVLGKKMKIELLLLLDSLYPY